MSKYNIGVDVGGTTVKIGVFDREKAAIDIETKTSIPTRTENDGVHILPDIAEAIAVLMEEYGAEMDDVARIGIGVPGPVITDRKTGQMFVNKCVNLGWSSMIDVPQELSELTGVQNISVINDANAAALGEVIAGSCSDKTVVVVTLGTGIGGGIVQSGRIMPGAFGAAGEIGHIKIQPQHPLIKNLSTLKPFADLEYYVSATGIARTAKAALQILPDQSILRDDLNAENSLTDKDKTSEDTGNSLNWPDAKAVMDAAKKGDALALKLTDFFFDTLGIGLASVAGVVDPDMFIIGGGVAGAGLFLTDGLQASYRKYVFHASSETEFRLAVLGNDAGMIGAACSGN